MTAKQTNTVEVNLPVTAAGLYAADCRRRGAMMQGGFGFLHPDSKRPWELLADLVNACDHCLDNKGDWVPEMADALERARGAA